MIGDPARRLGVQTRVVWTARSRPSLTTAGVNLNEDMFATTTKDEGGRRALAEEGAEQQARRPLPLVGRQ
eukprot:11282769-Heterocapsa_arctica.AAC.1